MDYLHKDQVSTKISSPNPRKRLANKAATSPPPPSQPPTSLLRVAKSHGYNLRSAPIATLCQKATDAEIANDFPESSTAENQEISYFSDLLISVATAPPFKSASSTLLGEVYAARWKIKNSAPLKTSGVNLPSSRTRSKSSKAGDKDT